jgi:hypothetical protein
MAETEERAVTKFARDAILTIVGGFVLEPTLQKVHIDVSPYLRQIWFGIGVFIALDGLKRGAKVSGRVRMFRDSLSKRNKMISYVIVALLCAALGVLYYWGLGKLFGQEKDSGVTLKFKQTALFFSAKHGSVFVQGMTVKLRAVYENTSDDPATQISANGVLRFIAGGQGMKDREEEEWNTFRAAWLASLQGTPKEELAGHQEKSFEVETDPLAPQDEQDLRDTTKYVYFMGAIKWTDKTGEYETDTCTYFSPNEHGGANAPAIWRSCLSGHSMVRRPFKFTDVRPAFSQRANVQIVQMGFPSDPSASDPKWVPGERILLRIQAINNGPAPANKMAGSFRIAISSGAAEQADQERLWDVVKAQSDTMPYGENSLMPGRDALIDVQYPLTLYHEVALTAEDIAQIKAGKRRILIAGIYKYIDDYGPRETHVCQSYSGTSWRYWNDCFRHNELVP